MRLYSDSLPTYVILCENERPRKRERTMVGPGGGGIGGLGYSARDLVQAEGGFTARLTSSGSDNESPLSGAGSGENVGGDGGSGSTLERAASEVGGPGESSASSPGGGGGVGYRLEGGGVPMRRRASVEEESQLVDMGMDLFVLTPGQQLSLVEQFFVSMELTEIFKTLRSFVRGVEEKYHPNPFHNLTHAVSVTHAAFTIVSTTQISSLLRPLDKLALLVAAFCHDVDHPGNNNAYEVNSLSPLALQHGDSSVLERHHVFVAYQILLQKGGANNIFKELTKAQFRDARQTIVQAILATDMSGHMQHCADVFQFAQRAKTIRAARGPGGVTPGQGGKEWVRGTSAPLLTRRGGRERSSASEQGTTPRGAGGGPERSGRRRSRPKVLGPASVSMDTARATEGSSPTAPLGVSASKSQKAGRRRGIDGDESRQGRWMDTEEEPRQLFSIDKAEDRSFLTKTVIHCADLSGQVLDTRLALEWGRRILEEFRMQADREVKAGLPLTTLASGDLETTMKGQHFFAAKIVKPLWEPFVALFPALDYLLANLNTNCEYYQHEASRLEKERISAQPQGDGDSNDINDGGGGDNEQDGDGGGVGAGTPRNEERVESTEGRQVGGGEREVGRVGWGRNVSMGILPGGGGGADKGGAGGVMATVRLNECWGGGREDDGRRKSRAELADGGGGGGGGGGGSCVEVFY
eukprot:jgi/Undpi1/5979/HiC_scaffold_2.g01253.m1